MIKEKIYIDNLKCGGCATNIKESLLSIKGVSDVSINHDESSVELQHDGENDRNLFLGILTKMGYPQLGTSTLLQKGKSYVSCAIGKVKEKTSK